LGYSSHGWTPILLHLSGVFVDADPRKVDRYDFRMHDDERDEPSVSKGKLADSGNRGGRAW
jgi:hypothetical protein